jgi:hypothetical protein
VLALFDDVEEIFSLEADFAVEEVVVDIVVTARTSLSSKRLLRFVLEQ